jgi:hypothetical protein
MLVCLFGLLDDDEVGAFFDFEAGPVVAPLPREKERVDWTQEDREGG